MLTIAIVGLVFIAVTALLALSMPALMRTFNQCNKFVKVVGIGRVSVRPDQASASVGVRTENVVIDTLPDARAKNAVQFNRLVNKIAEVAPDARVETRSFTVTPNYDTDTEQLLSYSVQNTADIQLQGENNLSQLSELVQVAMQNGANSVNNVYFALSDNGRARAAISAQQFAMADAEKKAKNLALHVQKSLGEAQQIMERNINEQPPFRLQSLSAERTASDKLTTDTQFLPPRDIEVASHVDVRYLLK